MQNNDNQTIQNDPQNGGQNEVENISPGVRSIWLGMRDSNPRSWDQNPLPYRLANPQYISLMSLRTLVVKGSGLHDGTID